MKQQKPIMHFNAEAQTFRANGEPVTDDRAVELWYSLAAEWSHGAFQEMTRRTLQPTTTTDPCPEPPPA